MATTQNISSNYEGKVAQEYFTKSFQSGDTIANGIITVLDKLKEKGTAMRRLDASDFIKDSTCKFDAQGQVDLDYRKLVPKKLQVNLEICLDELEGAWEAEDMGASANDNVPQPYINALMLVVAAKLGEANDRLIWQGLDQANEYEGILAKLAADPDFPAGQNIAGTAITAANVATELGKVADAIPDEVYSNDGDLVIAAASNITRAYMRALAGFGASGQGGAGYQAMGFVGKKPLDFEGIPMFKIGGLPKGCMVAYKVENVAFGTGLIADWTDLRVIDMRIIGDDTFRIKGKFLGGTQYAFSEEMVAYALPATS